MEIIYPENFIKFYNDDNNEIVAVGEFEILNTDDDLFNLISSEFDGYRFKPQLPEQFSKITSGIMNIPGMIYDTFRPPMSGFGPGPVMPPGGGPGPFMPPGGGPGPGKPPSGPPGGKPPGYIPAKTDQGVKKVSTSSAGGPQVKAVGPGTISFCLYKYTYIWQTNGRSYWAYLVYVDNVSVSGFRWDGWRWVYFGVDLRKIDSFVCY